MCLPNTQSLVLTLRAPRACGSVLRSCGPHPRLRPRLPHHDAAAAAVQWKPRHPQEHQAPRRSARRRLTERRARPHREPFRTVPTHQDLLQQGWDGCKGLHSPRVHPPPAVCPGHQGPGREAFIDIAPNVITLAQSEDLPAHGEAMSARLENLKNSKE